MALSLEGSKGWRRSDVLLAAGAIVCGVVFASSLQTLWPLVDTDLNVPSRRLIAEARRFLASRGLDTSGYRAASVLNVDDAVLDYVERAFGRDQAQDWIASGVPIVHYRVDFKKEGESTTYAVDFQPERGIIGWRRSLEEDEPGAHPTITQARAAAEKALADVLGLKMRYWTASAASAAERSDRRDHAFTFERVLSEDPELHEQVQVRLAGEEVVGVAHRLVLPGAATRWARSHEAAGIALETAGFLLAAIAAIGAFFVFLNGLRDGTARFDRPATWVGLLFACILGTQLLQSARLLGQWEPLVPLWIFELRDIVDFAVSGVWNLLLLLAVISAGDALDQRSGAGRGDALWSFSRGQFAQPRVGAASARGFFIGLICGAVMAGSVMLLQRFAGAHVALQPRGFFFYALNSTAPSLATLLFFLNVAMAEELGYRYFGGAWLLRMSGRKWVAVLLPALIYGLTHTRMDFLPPADPFWGRALVMTLVGCVWGWAFFRYDALTVVLSHFTADLFIFNWPRLASGAPGPTWAALATVAVPLVPAVATGIAWGVRWTTERPMAGVVEP